MAVNPQKYNLFLLFKVPAAWFCGVRIKEFNEEYCMVSVKHRWINQNPFKSMYFAVQAMAAELSTGAVVLKEVEKSKRRISMLVKENNASFVKKATGRITFECRDIDLIKDSVQKAIEDPEGITFWAKSVGRNKNGEVVSEFNFQWTLKLKQ